MPTPLFRMKFNTSLTYLTSTSHPGQLFNTSTIIKSGAMVAGICITSSKQKSTDRQTFFAMSTKDLYFVGSGSSKDSSEGDGHRPDSVPVAVGVRDVKPEMCLYR